MERASTQLEEERVECLQMCRMVYMLDEVLHITISLCVRDDIHYVDMKVRVVCQML